MTTQSNLDVLELLNSNAYTTSQDGAAVDLQGYINPGGRAMKAYLNMGVATGTAISIAAKLQESDTTTAGDFTDISGAAFTSIATTAASIEEIHFRTNKRYIRAKTTHGTNMTSGNYAIVVLAEKRMK